MTFCTELTSVPVCYTDKSGSRTLMAHFKFGADSSGDVVPSGTVITELDSSVPVNTSGGIVTIGVCPIKEYIYVGLLWKLQNPEAEGVKLSYWQPSAQGGSAVGHDDPRNIFGPALNNHPNPPDKVVKLPSTRWGSSRSDFRTLAGYASNAETNGTDQALMEFWVCQKGPSTMSDSNTNTGERGLVLINGSVAAEDNTDSVGGAASAFDPFDMPSGVSSGKIGLADRTAWMGVQPTLTGDGVFFCEEPCWAAMPVFKCSDFKTKGFVDCNGDEVEVGDKDFWERPRDNTLSSGGSDGGSSVQPHAARVTLS